MDKEKLIRLSADSYNRNYYLKSLPGIEYLEGKIDPAILKTIRLGAILPGERLLDFGCGRGNLTLELASRGCSAVGVDFSRDAIEFAEKYAQRFPEDVRKRAAFIHLTMEEFRFKNEFDVIVLNQVYEHLHDWELTLLLKKFKDALKSGGRLIISTPNLNYIRYLYPIKRMLEFPFKLIKELLRVLRRKSKHTSSFSAFLKEIFKIKYPESEHTKLHINLQTTSSLKKFVERAGFSADVLCVDDHTNWISKGTERWWGETIWAVAKVSRRN